MNNKNKSHPHAELIKAWTNGAEIQYWDDDDNKWIDCQGYSGFPTWDVELLLLYGRTSRICTQFRVVAQLVRAPHCHCGCRGFKYRQSCHFFVLLK